MIMISVKRNHKVEGEKGREEHLKEFGGQKRERRCIIVL